MQFFNGLFTALPIALLLWLVGIEGGRYVYAHCPDLVEQVASFLDIDGDG